MSTVYMPKLDDQEIMSLQALVLHPGYRALLKMLDTLAFLAQAEAMGCKSPDADVRLKLLTDAQVASTIVSNLKIMLETFKPESVQQEPYDPMAIDFGQIVQ